MSQHIDKTHLSVGDKAPFFEAENQNGDVVKLTDFTGKKVILYFYPKDDTPGCTKEACNFRDNYSALTKEGFEVVGVSPDKVAKHKKFETKYELPFTLLADPELTILKAYGAYGRKKFMGKEVTGVLRSTFVIDESGTISAIIDKVKTKEATEQVLASV
ncbi:MAG: thioredoxin-dependent thiol peroxidase [Saprospiraceae bacterium]|nr:thioredoxin-dependent thiol peroxidase [Saprospiraceae bacterium]